MKKNLTVIRKYVKNLYKSAKIIELNLMAYKKYFYRGYVVEIVKKGVIVTSKNGVPFAAASLREAKRIIDLQIAVAISLFKK